VYRHRPLPTGTRPNGAIQNPQSSQEGKSRSASSFSDRPFNGGYKSRPPNLLRVSFLCGVLVSVAAASIRRALVARLDPVAASWNCLRFGRFRLSFGSVLLIPLFCYFCVCRLAEEAMASPALICDTEQWKALQVRGALLRDTSPALCAD
jgi:hypothetical protein